MKEKRRTVKQKGEVCMWHDLRRDEEKYNGKTECGEIEKLRGKYKSV